MPLSTRRWVTACLFAWVGCFTESATNDDGGDATSGNTDPTLTTTVDPSVTTSMTTTTSDPTSETDPPVDSSGTTASDTDPDTTSDPTMGGCPGQGEAVCDDTMVVVGELCFLAPETIGGGTEQIGDFAIADIDGNGTADVAFADGANGYVAFVENASLQDASPVAPFIATWSVAVGPLGDNGAVAVAFGGASAFVNIFRFVGSTSSTEDPLLAPGDFVTVRMADFTNDAQLDLIVGSEVSTTLYLYFNDGSGGFPTLTDLSIGAVVGVADMRILYDGDFEVPGIAVLTRDGRLIATPPSNTAPGDFVEIDPSTTYGDPTVAMLAAGDLDDDDDTDLAVAYDGRAFVFRATESGYMKPQPLGERLTGDVAAAIADIDNDGLADVLLADPNGTEIEIYTADGNGFAQAPSIQVPEEPRGVGVADFNADCAADIVALGPDWLDVVASNP